MSCSFFSEDSPCGPAPGKNDITTIPVKSCANDVYNHLTALCISGRTGDRKITEDEVIFNRGGFISPSEKQVNEFTVCPGHRYRLTNGWAGRKRLTCFHPNHPGKRVNNYILDALTWNCRGVSLLLKTKKFRWEQVRYPLCLE